MNTRRPRNIGYHRIMPESNQEIIRNPANRDGDLWSYLQSMVCSMRRVHLEGRPAQYDAVQRSHQQQCWCDCNCSIGLKKILFVNVFFYLFGQDVNTSFVLFAEDFLFEVDFFSWTVRVVRKLLARPEFLSLPTLEKSSGCGTSVHSSTSDMPMPVLPRRKSGLA